VRVGEQAEGLELGELGANGRRRRSKARVRDQRLGAHRPAGSHVLHDDAPQNLLLPLRQLQLDAHLQDKF
jgi:hypothetical protein